MNRKEQQRNGISQNFQNYFQNNNSSFKQFNRRRIYNTRFIPNVPRNNLQHAQNVFNFQRSYYQKNPSNYNNENNNNVNNREIYVKGLPRYVDDQILFNLFREEGRIINCNILYDNVGFSRGIGRILFANFRDAMNVIKKWDNCDYKGNILKVEYKMTKNVDNNTNIYNKKFDKNNRNNNYFKSLNGNRVEQYGNNFKRNYYYKNKGYNGYQVFKNNNNDYY